MPPSSSVIGRQFDGFAEAIGEGVVVAASIAGGVHSAMFGSGPLFSVPPHEFAGLDKLPIFAVLGLVAGLLAVVISKGLFAVEHAFRRLPIGESWHPIIGAVGFGLVGLAVPRALGVGYDAIDDILAGTLPVAVLSALLVAKLVAWWIALGSGTSGGTLAPVLVHQRHCGGPLRYRRQRVFPRAGTRPRCVRAGRHGRHVRRRDPRGLHVHRFPVRVDA